MSDGGNNVKPKVFITGDCHGDFKKIELFCQYQGTSRSDVMIILGDAGINYWLDERDRKLKQKLASLPITFLCISGNHEERPRNISSYVGMEWHGGTVYVEKEFPNILFAKDGEIYDLDGKSATALGGAYSVDKEFRLLSGLPWFEDEQPSDEIKAYVERKLSKSSWRVDYVLSHTCPYKFLPLDLLLKTEQVGQTDKATEDWLSKIEKRLSYSKWYFGHFHGNREYASGYLLYEEIREVGKDDFLQRLGRPEFQGKERVIFGLVEGEKEWERYGVIVNVYADGTQRYSREITYDIMDMDKILHEHVAESNIYRICK